MSTMTKTFHLGDILSIRWLAEQVAIYGETREVAPLAAGDHTSIDPLDELRAIRPDAEVIVVEVPENPS